MYNAPAAATAHGRYVSQRGSVRPRRPCNAVKPRRLPFAKRRDAPVFPVLFLTYSLPDMALMGVMRLNLRNGMNTAATVTASVSAAIVT